MCLREDIAKEARREGSAAFRSGLLPPWNPHQIGTREFSAWHEGWVAESNFALEKKLFPKELTESEEYLSFKRCLFPNSTTLTTDSFLSHWWWNKMERKRMFELWKDQE